MSVLQFIAAIKWPITVLIVIGFFAWWTQHNPHMGSYVRSLISSRDVRLDIAGQKLELTGAAASAMVTATQPDEILADAAGNTDQDVTEVRRDAVEEIIRYALNLGYNTAASRKGRPEVKIRWTQDGTPQISIGTVWVSPNLRWDELRDRGFVAGWGASGESARED